MSSSSPLYPRLHSIFSDKRKISVNLKTSIEPTKPISEEHQNIVQKFKKLCDTPTIWRLYVNLSSAIHRLDNNSSSIEEIIEHQKQYPDIQNESFVSRLILFYGKAKMFGHARKLFDEMPSLKCERTVYSFNALLESCIKAEKYDMLRELFRELPEELSIEPDVVSYNTLIKDCCKAGSLESAVNVMEEMESNGIKPNNMTFTTLLNACYDSKRFSDAEDLWGLMREKGVVANSLSYHMWLRCLVDDSRVIEAIWLFDEMRKNDIVPHFISYNTMIKMYTEDENLDEGKIWYEKMVENGQYPDRETFNKLINYSCDKGNLYFTLELCEKALNSKVSVNETIMQRVVDGLAENSKLEDAKKLVNLAKSYDRFWYKLLFPSLQ